VFQMPRFHLWLLLLLPGFVLAAPIPAGIKAKDIKDVPLPADSLVVLQFNGSTRMKERATAMLKNVDPTLVEKFAEQFDVWSESLTGGRDLSSIDTAGKWFVALSSFDGIAGGEVPLSVLIPVTSYKAFKEKTLKADERDSLKPIARGVEQCEFDGKTIYLVEDKSGYVIATLSSTLAESYTEKFEKLTPKALGTLAESVLEADASIYINIDGINAKYAAVIAQGKQVLPLLLGQLQQNLPADQAASVQFFLDAAFRNFEDCRALAFSAELRPEGLNIRTEAELKAGSTTAVLLKNEKPVAHADLGTLPAKQSLYTAGSFTLATSLGRLLVKEFQAAEADDDGAEAIKPYASFIEKETHPSLHCSGAVASVQFERPVKLAEYAKAKLAAFGGLKAGSKHNQLALKNDAKVAVDAEKFAGFTLHRAMYTIDYEASVSGTAIESVKDASIEAMKKQTREKQTYWFGTDGKRYVQVQAEDWPTAKALLEKATTDTGALNGESGYKALRAQLPAEATYYVLANTASVVENVESMRSIIPVTPGLPTGEFAKLTPVKDANTYIGLALAIRPTRVGLDVFMPVAAVKQLYDARPKRGE